MFEGDLHLSSYGHLRMHWAVMLPPSILLVHGPLLSRPQLISAQSPQYIKGLIVGLFSAIIGLFEVVGALALILFSVKEVWDTTSMTQNPPITNFGFGDLVSQLLLHFLALSYLQLWQRIHLLW